MCDCLAMSSFYIKSSMTLSYTLNWHKAIPSISTIGSCVKSWKNLWKNWLHAASTALWALNWCPVRNIGDGNGKWGNLSIYRWVLPRNINVNVMYHPLLGWCQWTGPVVVAHSVCPSLLCNVPGTHGSAPVQPQLPWLTFFHSNRAIEWRLEFSKNPAKCVESLR